jgi:hypothetical protein
LANGITKYVNEFAELPNYVLTYAKISKWEAQEKENTLMGKIAGNVGKEAEDLLARSHLLLV